MFDEAKPRSGMITHTNHEEELMGESVAAVRAYWKGMFIFGAPDVMVVNITPDSIWARKAAIPPGSATPGPFPARPANKCPYCR